MITVNIHEAKTNLSKLIQMAVDGHPFVIAKAGKPLVTVRAIESAVEVRVVMSTFLVSRACAVSVSNYPRRLELHRAWPIR